ncbi:MAG: hypothetical protein ACE361_05135 [Aureliella sp.]
MRVDQGLHCTLQRSQKVPCIHAPWLSLIAASIVCVALASGCATHAKRLASPRTSFYGGDLQRASAQLLKLEEKRSHDRSVVELDLAMVELFQGNVDSAEARLRAIRDNWDHYEQSSLAESASSYILDDNTRAYSGEDYERILVRVMLTLCSLVGDGVDAESYSLQTLAKQQELLSRARKRWDENLEDQYCVPPIAPYLRGVLRESTLSDYHEAEKHYRRAAMLMPEDSFVEADILRSQNGVHSQPGHGVVYVIALVGRGPYKEEVSAPATQAALQAADAILSAIGEYSVPPTLAPVKVPAILCPPKPFDLVGVAVDGVPASTTMPITDLDQLATDSYQAKYPQLLARTVARRIVKKGTIYAAKDHFEADSDLASIAFSAAGVLWEATESADTRCWGLLPREIQILRLELPAGVHRLELEPVAAGNVVAKPTTCSLRVANGQNSYVLSYWPGTEPIGGVLVSQNSRL